MSGMSVPTIFSDFLTSLNTQLRETMSFMDQAKSGVQNNRADSNAYARSLRSAEYEYGARTLQALSHDFKELTNLSNSLSKFEFSSEDMKHLTGAVTQIRSLANNLGNLFSINTSRFASLNSDEDYVKNIIFDKSRGSDFRKIYDNLYNNMSYFRNHPVNIRGNIAQKERSTIIENTRHELFDNFMKDLTSYIVKTSLDPTQRGDFMKYFSGMKFNKIDKFSDYQEMLPKSFRSLHNSYDLNKGAFKTISDTDFRNGRDTGTLTKKEYDYLQSVIKTNPYVAQAAESAGLLTRRQGNLFMDTRHQVTRERVGAMSGFLYQMIENGAKGMGMYGIRDVNDPKAFEKILNKTNNMLSESLSGARFLDDVFGKWLKPIMNTREQLEQMAPLASVVNGVPTSRYGVNIGRVNFPVRPRAYQMTSYTMDEIMNGISYQHGDPYNEEDAKHKQSINSSLELDALMKLSHGKP